MMKRLGQDSSRSSGKAARYRPVLAFCLIWMLLAAQGGPLQAASPTQGIDQAQNAATSLLLGEYVYQAMEAGEEIVYEVYAPESGDYTILPNEDDLEGTFDLMVTDSDGESLFEGPLDDIDLALEAGAYHLAYTAQEDGLLSFFVLGYVGTMSSSNRELGKLYPGSVYNESGVSSPRYASLIIPSLPTPQEVLLYVEAGANDLFTIWAENDDLGYVQLSTDSGDLLRFWTEGGEYLLTAEPADRRSSFSLIPFLSGPAPILALDEEVEGSVSPDARQLVYHLRLDTFYESLTVDLQGADDEIDLDLALVDRLYNGSFYESSADLGSTEVLELSSLIPGDYYVVIDRYSELEEPFDFTLFASGTAGEPLAWLESGVAVDGELAGSDDVVYYEFDVSQAGALVSVVLTSDEEEVDFDLGVGLRPGTNMKRSASSAANEALSFVAPVAGIFYVEVRSYQGSGAYQVVAEEGDLAPALLSNELAFGEVGADDTTVYRLEVAESGKLLSVILVGYGESDLDLRVDLYDARGETVHSLASTTTGPYEIVSQAMATPGVYEVAVTSYGSADQFAVLVRLEDAQSLLSASLRVVNNSEVEVCSLFITPLQAETEVDVLAEGETILPGADYMAEMDAGSYDLRVVDCNGDEIANTPGAFLQGIMTWAVP